MNIKKNKKIVVANWKMRRSYQEALNWAQEHKTELAQLVQQTELVICPDFTALAPLTTMVKDTNILIGAQNCADHETGSYTGEVSVKSLAEIGCAYTIIGHSERREYYGEKSSSIAQKCLLLWRYSITPIICIGETAQEHQAGDTQFVLKQQLGAIIEPIKNFAPASANPSTSLPTSPRLRRAGRMSGVNKNILIVAYEPIWAIGTGTVPTEAEITKTIAFLQDYLRKSLPETQVKLLYGGSVDTNSIEELVKIPNLDGFLIGSASLDFQNLKKIISYII